MNYVAGSICTYVAGLYGRTALARGSRLSVSHSLRPVQRTSIRSTGHRKVLAAWRISVGHIRPDAIRPSFHITTLCRSLGTYIYRSSFLPSRQIKNVFPPFIQKTRHLQTTAIHTSNTSNAKEYSQTLFQHASRNRSKPRFRRLRWYVHDRIVFGFCRIPH